MLLTLLNINKEKIASLSNITECNLTQQINTIDRLEFTIPYADKNAQLIEEETYVQSKDDLYVIKALEINAKEIRCECRQDTELLSSKLHNNGFTSLTANISDTLNLAFLQTGYVVHTMGILTKKRTLKLASTNALDILFTAVKKFGFEFRINSLTKVVTIAEEFGTDKGTYFSDQLNAEEISLSTDTLDFATRLYARGKDGLTFSDINGGKDYAENYSYSTKIVNKYWEDNRYTVKSDLLEDATKKLENLCKPSKSYSVSILDLASLKAEYNYLSFNLGDSITLINSKNKYRDKQRIVEINRDLINVHNINVTLANNLLNFEQLQERNEETSEVVEEIVNEDNTISGKVLEDKTVTNEKLAVNSITAENIKANSITSDKILAGAITSTKIEAGAITAGSGIIAEGAIGDAQISKLSATKLSAGIIDASYIEVKNLNADNLIVGTINGERIKNGAIDNSKVADNANISGSKLNINDVIVNINGASTQINGTKIQVGDRTLDAELSTQKIINNNTTETISKQASSINALDNAIKLKVDNQTYTSDLEGVNTKLNKNTANIDLMQKSIELKVSQTDVNNTISNIKLGGTNIYPRPTEELATTRLLQIQTAEIFKNHIGKTVTISFDLKCEITRPINMYAYQSRGISIDATFGNKVFSISKINEYERFTCTTTIKDWGLTPVGNTAGAIAFYDATGTQNYSIKNIEFIVDKVPFTEKITQIDTQVAGININLDGITQKVEKTETDFTNFKKVKRNLYPNPTEELKSTRFLAIPTAEIFKNHVGKSITISFDMKCEIARPIQIYPYQNNGISIEGLRSVKVAEVNKYERFTFTTIIKDWGINNETWTKGAIAFYETIDTQNFSIKNINLEIDEIVTMQDVDVKVAETITNIDNITQRVGSTETKLGNPNLMPFPNSFNVGWGTATTTCKGSLTVDGYLKVASTPSTNNIYNGWCKGYEGIETQFTEGEDFTISFAMKVDAYYAPKIFLKDGMGYFNLIKSTVLDSQFTIYKYSGKWKKANLIDFFLDFSEVNGSVTIKFIKLEKGINATPYMSIGEAYTRVNSAEQKLTSTSILSTINTSVNDGTGAIDTVYTRLDKDGFTIKNGGLKIKNKADETVLSGDVNGNLSMLGEFKTLRDTGGTALSIKNANLSFHKLDGTKKSEFMGSDWGFNADILKAGESGINIGQLLGDTHLVTPMVQLFRRFSNPYSILLSSNTQVNADFLVNAESKLLGNVVLGNNLNVNGGMWVAGETTFDGNVKIPRIGSNINVSGGIWSAGDVKFDKSLSIGNNLNVNGGMWVAGETTFDGNVKIPNTLVFGNDFSGSTPKVYKNGSSLVAEVPNTNVGDGFLLKYTGGANIMAVRLGNSYPISLEYSTGVDGNFTVKGSKNSLQVTEHYGERLINAYETAEYYFGDIGEGTINTQGECMVYIDEILQECINTKCAYQVFTQVYEGNITKIERHENYFIVYGEPNTTFSWELKAKRKGYENVRLDKPSIGTMENKAHFADEELKNNTSEKALTEILDFNLENILI